MLFLFAAFPSPLLSPILYTDTAMKPAADIPRRA